MDENQIESDELEQVPGETPQLVAVAASKKTHPYRRLKRVALFLLSTYVGICVMLAIIQKKLIYQPARESSLRVADTNLSAERFHDISVKTAKGLTLRGWHVLPPGSVAMDEQERKWELEQSRPVILFFPGNAGHRGYRSSELDFLSQLNADVMLVDYRGYGDNPGIPSEKNFQQDARAIWDHLVETEKIKPSRILIFGESLGGGVATALANELAKEGVEPGGLFLKTTFFSFVDVASHHFPWLPCNLLLSQRYPSGKKIVDVTCPITILHGIHDEIVPFEMGQELFEAAPDQSISKKPFPKNFIELPAAGHNNVMQTEPDAYQEAVAKMLHHIRRN